MALDLLLIAAGAALLAFSGDKLVDFASAAAERAGVTPAVVGLTVVAAGTSAPELFVSVTAGLKGSSDIALANVVGSNIANIAFILGVTALVSPVPVDQQAARLDYPFMLLASWLTLLLCRDGLFDRLEAVFFLLGLAAFMAYAVLAARKVLSPSDKAELGDLVPERADALSLGPFARILGGLALSVAGLGLGSDLLVRGASSLAAGLGVSERVVGLTVVAVGTSLPELVASLAAARRGQHAMAVANVVGSNTFNVLGILGAAALVRPVSVKPQILRVDLWVMLAAAALAAPSIYWSRRVSRSTGAGLAAAYAGYVAWLALG